MTKPTREVKPTKARKQADIELEMFMHRLHLNKGIDYDDMFHLLDGDQCLTMRQGKIRLVQAEKPATGGG